MKQKDNSGVQVPTDTGYWKPPFENENPAMPNPAWSMHMRPLLKSLYLCKFSKHSWVSWLMHKKERNPRSTRWMTLASLVLR